MSELIYCVFTISVFCFQNWILKGRLLQLKCLESRALCLICLRLEYFRRQLFIRLKLTFDFRRLKLISRLTHAEKTLFFLWAVALIGFNLLDFNISSPCFFIQIIACCHWFLIMSPIGVILLAIVFRAQHPKLRSPTICFL